MPLCYNLFESAAEQESGVTSVLENSLHHVSRDNELSFSLDIVMTEPLKFYQKLVSELGLRPVNTTQIHAKRSVKHLNLESRKIGYLKTTMVWSSYCHISTLTPTSACLVCGSVVPWRRGQHRRPSSSTSASTPSSVPRSACSDTRACRSTTSNNP